MFGAPRSDDPATAFDESDVPASQIGSVISHIELASLAESLSTPPASLWLEFKLPAPGARAVAATYLQVNPDSLASFLCTFVC